MTTLLSVGAGLAVVLGLTLVLAGALRRFTGGGTSPHQAIEVVDRAGLSPKQGVALVRFRDREVAVSYGEGGVRLLLEMETGLDRPAHDGDEPTEFRGILARVEEDDAAIVRPRSTEVRPSWPPFIFGDPTPGIWHRVRAALRQALTGLGVVAVAALALGAGATGATAQEGPAEVPGETLLPEALQEGGAAAQGPGILDVLGKAQGMPSFTLQGGEGDDEPLVLSGPVGMVVFLGFMTLLPTLLLLMTSFTRILVVLNLLKQALGLQTAPPGHLIVALSLLLTGFVMAPTLERVNATAFGPWVEGTIDEAEMLRRGVVPFREFMLSATGEEELGTMVELSADAAPASVAEIPTMTLTSAFVMSELRAAFQMGFALFLPFLVIDIVVASVLMSMGMFMLPPVMVSLPLKLLLFVLVDGWSLIVGGLVRSFA